MRPEPPETELLAWDLPKVLDSHLAHGRDHEAFIIAIGRCSQSDSPVSFKNKWALKSLQNCMRKIGEFLSSAAGAPPPPHSFLLAISPTPIDECVRCVGYAHSTFLTALPLVFKIQFAKSLLGSKWNYKFPSMSLDQLFCLEILDLPECSLNGF